MSLEQLRKNFSGIEPAQFEYIEIQNYDRLSFYDGLLNTLNTVDKNHPWCETTH